jgi:glycosyltransferase involved in cell wall biosynthesis
MRVAFDVSYIQKRRSGIGRYALSLLRDLLRIDSSHEFLLHGWSWSLDIAALHQLSSSRVQFRTARIPGHVKRFYWDRLRHPDVQTLIGPFDLFHSFDPFAPPAAFRPVIVTVHDLISRSHPQYFTSGIIARDMHIARSLGRASAVVVPSRFTWDELASTGWIDPSHIHLAPPPIPSLFTHESNPLDQSLIEALGVRQPYILYVGTIEPRKNVASLIRGFEQVCDSGITANLVIAGKQGWLSEDIPAKIRSSHHASRIRHLDYVSDETLAALYRNAVCFIYPSFVEGYGSPVAEALASGVPVITSDSSGMAEIAGDGAILIDPASLRQLHEEMEKLMTSAAYRESVRARGLKRAGELRSNNRADVVVRLYESLAQP